MDAVIEASHRQLPPTRAFDSRRLDLSTSFGDYDSVAAAFAAAAARVPEAGLPRDTRVHLARLYGTGHEKVLALVAGDRTLAARLGGSADIAAQAVHAVTEEAARTLADVLDRRLTVGTLGLVDAVVVKQVADLIAPLLGWAQERSQVEVDAYLAAQRGRVEVLDEAFRG